MLIPCEIVNDIAATCGLPKNLKQTAEARIEYSENLPICFCFFFFLSDIQGLLRNQNGDSSSGNPRIAQVSLPFLPSHSHQDIQYLVWYLASVTGHCFWQFPMQKQKPLTWHQMAWQLPRQSTKRRRRRRRRQGGGGPNCVQLVSNCRHLQFGFRSSRSCQLLNLFY